MNMTTSMMQVTFGKSRVRESPKPGSVKAKAEWLSYSTTILANFSTEPSAGRGRSGQNIQVNMCCMPQHAPSIILKQVLFSHSMSSSETPTHQRRPSQCSDR